MAVTQIAEFDGEKLHTQKTTTALIENNIWAAWWQSWYETVMFSHVFRTIIPKLFILVNTLKVLTRWILSMQMWVLNSRMIEYLYMDTFQKKKSLKMKGNVDA